MRDSSTPLLLVSFLSLLLLGSCATTQDEEDPEGTTYDSVPPGYAPLLVGGITYYYLNDHYCRHWPDRGYVVVRPPQGRPPSDLQTSGAAARTRHDGHGIKHLLVDFFFPPGCSRSRSTLLGWTKVGAGRFPDGDLSALANSRMIG